MNWITKKYGKGMTYFSMIFIIAFCTIIALLTKLWIGALVLSGFALIFWFNRNTK